VRNSLPKDSLTWKDLRFLGDDQLNRRLIYLGKEMGADKAISRISSVPELQLPRGQPTLYGWWKAASTKQRFTLMSVSKKIGSIPQGENENELLARLTVGQYPFRGTDRKIQENESEQEEEEEIESPSGLEIDFSDLNI